MRIELKLLDKNGALIPYENAIEAESVPRVGEIIDLGTGFESKWGNPSTFIVVDAKWTINGGTLVPTLTCHRWLDGDRHLELSVVHHSFCKFGSVKLGA